MVGAQLTKIEKYARKIADLMLSRKDLVDIKRHELIGFIQRAAEYGYRAAEESECHRLKKLGKKYLTKKARLAKELEDESVL